jgi:hypothetical protein
VLQSFTFLSLCGGWKKYFIVVLVICIIVFPEGEYQNVTIKMDKIRFLNNSLHSLRCLVL